MQTIHQVYISLSIVDKLVETIEQNIRQLEPASEKNLRRALCSEAMVTKRLLNKLADEYRHKPPVNLEVTPEEVGMALTGKKIAAIKPYRSRTGSTLIDAKHRVESAMHE